jgi:ISXO2-like transposase domain
MTGDGYTHGAVKHADEEWGWYDWRMDETFSTNSVEGFWRLFKASVRSMHTHISEKQMPAYLAELV